MIWGAIAILLLGAAPATVSPLAPGTHRRSLEHGGRERTFLVHVPPPGARSAAAPLPMVIAFHGGGSNADNNRRFSGLDATSDRHGFVVVYPDGTGARQDRLLTWNAGACCGSAARERVDDVGFVRALVAELAGLLPIDRRRIYATGMSNGAMMSYRLGSEAADLIAAIAPVAGTALAEPLRPARPVPVLHIHSVDDPRALYGGGLGPPFPATGQRALHPPVEETVARWAEVDTCPSAPRLADRRAGQPGTPSAGHTATKQVWAPCAGGTEVVLWKLSGAGHVWPGSPRDQPLLLGAASGVIDANEEIWAFLSRFHLD